MKKIISIIFVMLLVFINKNIIVKADSDYTSSLTCSKSIIEVGETTTCTVYIDKTNNRINYVEGGLYTEDSILEISNESVQYYYKDSDGKYVNENVSSPFILTFEVKGISEGNDALIGFGVIDETPYVGVDSDKIDELLTTISVTASESNSESSDNNNASSENNNVNSENNNEESSNSTIKNETTEDISDSNNSENEISTNENTDKKVVEEDQQQTSNPQTGIEKPYIYGGLTLIVSVLILSVLKKKSLLFK